MEGRRVDIARKVMGAGIALVILFALVMPGASFAQATAPANPAVQATTEPTVTTPTATAPIRQIESESIRASGLSHSATTQTSTQPTAVKLPSGISNAAQVAAALVVVIGLILIGKTLVKKFVPAAKLTNGKGVMEILARQPLNKNQSITLVRIGSQIVAINEGKETSQSILVIDDENEVANILGQVQGNKPNSIQAGFNKMLNNARRDLEDPKNDPDRERDEEADLRSMSPFALDEQVDEMASAKRQLMELRQQVRSVRDSLPQA